MVTRDPVVSVVVATYQRPEALAQLVAALERQVGAPAFEVVVVDDASQDDTPARLADLAARSPLDLRHLRAPRNGGPAAARNIGVAHARGDVVAFTDDDCLPDPDWLRRGVRRLVDGVPAVVGRVTPPPDDQGGTFSRRMVAEDTRFFATANVFYRRADVLAAGGFDERFRKAGGEDTDLGLRVVATAGGTPVFAPDATVVHPVTADDWRTAVRIAWRWADIVLVLRLHPQARSLVHRRWWWKATHPPTLLAIGALLVTPPAAWAAGASVGRWTAGAVVAAGMACLLPWLRLRWHRQPLAASRSARLRTLPGVFLVDAAEVAAMVRGSIRHRTVLL